MNRVPRPTGFLIGQDAFRHPQVSPIVQKVVVITETVIEELEKAQWPAKTVVPPGSLKSTWKDDANIRHTITGAWSAA